MAWRLHKELSVPGGQGGGESCEGRRVLHVCGRLHAEHWLGVLEHLEAYRAAAAGGDHLASRFRDHVKLVVCMTPSDFFETSKRGLEKNNDHVF